MKDFLVSYVFYVKLDEKKDVFGLLYKAVKTLEIKPIPYPKVQD